MTPIYQASHQASPSSTRFQGAFWLLGMALVIETTGLVVILFALTGLV